MINKIRHYGTDYEGYIEEVDGQLKYSLIVERGFTGSGFTFDIEKRDLEVLKKDRYRYAALYQVMHTLLQNTMVRLPSGKPPLKIMQEQFRQIASTILFSSDQDLKTFIDDFGVKHNIAMEKYIGEQGRQVIE
jgi:hypothetical protein